MSSRSLAEVFADHLQCRQAHDLEGDLARNYGADVAILTSDGVLHGHDGIRTTAARLRGQLPDARYDYRTRLVAGDVAFLEWGATCDGTRVDDGADSYVIRDGRIRAQTIHYTVTRRDDADAGTGLASSDARR